VPGHLLLTNCTEDEVARPAIERALKADTLLWLDLADTGPDTIALLREVFNIHPLAVEDAQEFSERPKIEDYEDFVYIVAYGWLVTREGSLGSFLIFGIGTEAAAVAGLLFLFRRRGWM
jgi:Mg2+ and Co2+ transporter CorA